MTMAQTQVVRGVATTIHSGMSEGKQTMQVWYHKTCVVEFTDDWVKFHTGGWQTVTTRLRMNQASNQFGLGWGVSQRKGKLFARRGDVQIPFDQEITLERNPLRTRILRAG